jgi:hypothetical protein
VADLVGICATHSLVGGACHVAVLDLIRFAFASGIIEAVPDALVLVSVLAGQDVGTLVLEVAVLVRAALGIVTALVAGLVFGAPERQG